MRGTNRTIIFTFVALYLLRAALFPIAATDNRDDSCTPYDPQTLLEHFTGDYQAYRLFLQDYSTYNATGFDRTDDFVALEMCRARNILPHPYLAGYLDSAGEVVITGFRAQNYWVDDYVFQCVCVPDVVIPDEIDGHPVTRIAEDAFAYYMYERSLVGDPDTFIRSVVIGDNVRVIERYAFDWNPDLITLTLGKNVEILQQNAFANCFELQTITTWGEKLREMHPYCLSGCGASELPPLPSTVEYIGCNAIFYAQEGFVIPSSVKRMHSTALNCRGAVILSRDMVIDETDKYPLNYHSQHLNGYIYCYAGSTAEANAQKFGYTYYLIDGESLVFDGQAVEGNELQITDAMTEADFLARVSSNGEECEVRLSGLSDGKVVNGTTVTLWNNRVDAEGKVYTVQIGNPEIPDPLELYYQSGGKKLDSYGALFLNYKPFLYEFVRQYYGTSGLDDFDYILSREFCRAYNNDFPHPYLAGEFTEDGEAIIRGLKITGYYQEEWTRMGVQDVVIPDEIEGHPVTKICAFAFEDIGEGIYYTSYPAMQTITIGDNVRVIEDRAFNENGRIRSVTFGKNVEKIEYCAFWNCGIAEIKDWGESLREIGSRAFAETSVAFPPLPNTLETIGEKAFEFASLPDRIVIPKGTERIGSDAFRYTEGITELVILSRNAVIEGDLANTYNPVDLFCYAGSTAEANAQQFERMYHLIDGESLVFDGQTVEGNVLQITDAMTETDFLARAASNGEECEVRLSGLSDGKVVNGTTVTLWNNRVDAEGKVYVIQCGQDARVAGDTDGDGSIGLADVTLLIRYLAGGWNVTINLSAADVDGDGLVNLKDATLLRRFIAGGWNVVLK